MIIINIIFFFVVYKDLFICIIKHLISNLKIIKNSLVYIWNPISRFYADIPNYLYTFIPLFRKDINFVFLLIFLIIKIELFFQFYIKTKSTAVFLSFFFPKVDLTEEKNMQLARRRNKIMLCTKSK